MAGNQFIPVSIRETSKRQKEKYYDLTLAHFEVLNKLYSTISPPFRIDFVIFIHIKKKKKIKGREKRQR